MTLRIAASDDAAILLNTITQAFEDYRGRFDPPSGVFSETVESIRGKVEKGGGFLAFLNDAVAGCVLYQPEADHMYLGRLAVLPEFRGYGIARVLVEAVENRARELKLPRVVLGVRIALTGNQAIFEKLGYHVLYEGKHDGYDEITYLQFEKHL